MTHFREQVIMGLFFLQLIKQRETVVQWHESSIFTNFEKVCAERQPLVILSYTSEKSKWRESVRYWDTW